VLDRLLRESDRAPGAILSEHRPNANGLPAAVAAATALARAHALRGERALRFAMGQVLRAQPRGRLDPLQARAQLEGALR
jgi:hypothetical protein